MAGRHADRYAIFGAWMSAFFLDLYIHLRMEMPSLFTWGLFGLEVLALCVWFLFRRRKDQREEQAAIEEIQARAAQEQQAK